MIIAILSLAILSAPARAETGHGFTAQQCDQKSGYGMTFPFRKTDKKFLPECAPDTLYIWKKPEYVAQDVERHKNPVPGEPKFCLKPHDTMFAWRTPMGSYGYARDSIRIKLKHNTHFIYIDDEQRDCDYLKAQFRSDALTSVFAVEHVGFDGYHEYILCSDWMIESWSTGTPEHLQEIRDEDSWIRKEVAAGTRNYDKLSRMSDGYLAAEGASIEFDRVRWTQELFDQGIALHQQKIDQSRGGVFFCYDAKKDRASHFATKFPNYFNGRKARSGRR